MAGLGCCGRPQGPPALGLAAVPPSTGSWSKGEGAKAQTAASRGGPEPRIGSSWPLGAPGGRVQVGMGTQSCSSPLSPLADGAPLSEFSWSSSLSVVAVSFSGLFTVVALMLACLCCKKGGIGFKVRAGGGRPRTGFPGPALWHPLGTGLPSLLGLPGDHGDPGLGPHKPLFWGQLTET